MFKHYQLKIINLFNILHITMHMYRWVTTHVATPAESHRSDPCLGLSDWGVIKGRVTEDDSLSLKSSTEH